MTIEQQAGHVRKVKRSQSGMIQDPITLDVSAKVQDAVRIMQEFNIGGIPVVDGEKKLLGIITNRDLRFQKDFNLPVEEMMTKEKLITAEEGVGLEAAEGILQEHRIEKLPIVDKDGTLRGLITYKDILKNRDRPNSCKDEFGRLRVGAAVGVTPDMNDRIAALQKAGADVICVDTAHGHSKGVIESFKKAKATFPELEFVVGNVATPDGAKALAEAGADAIKSRGGTWQYLYHPCDCRGRDASAFCCL